MASSVKWSRGAVVVVAVVVVVIVLELRDPRIANGDLLVLLGQLSIGTSELGAKTVGLTLRAPHSARETTEAV